MRSPTWLLAPSPSGLSKLLSICQGYAASSELSYIDKETVVMCFEPKKLKEECTFLKGSPNFKKIIFEILLLYSTTVFNGTK